MFTHSAVEAVEDAIISFINSFYIFLFILNISFKKKKQKNQLKQRDLAINTYWNYTGQCNIADNK